MAPVGDAMRLVDDQQTGARGEAGQHVVAEVGIVQPLRADQQHVDRAGADLGGDLAPLVEVGRVDRAGADAGPGGRLDLVAHQREQRRHDDGRAGRRLAGPRPRCRRGAARWPRSRPPTCPSRCAARRAPGGGRRPAPRSPATGPRAGRRARRPGGAAPPRRARAQPGARPGSRIPGSFLPRRMSTSRHRQDGRCPQAHPRFSSAEGWKGGRHDEDHCREAADQAEHHRLGV